MLSNIKSFPDTRALVRGLISPPHFPLELMAGLPIGLARFVDATKRCDCSRNSIEDRHAHITYHTKTARGRILESLTCEQSVTSMVERPTRKPRKIQSTIRIAAI